MRRALQAGSRLLNSSSALRAATQPCLSTSSRLYSGETITCTLFPGDGIGPEIADAVKTIFEASKAPIEWDEQYIGKVADPRTNSMVTRENLDSVLVRCSLHYYFPTMLMPIRGPEIASAWISFMLVGLLLNRSPNEQSGQFLQVFILVKIQRRCGTRCA